MPTADWRRLYSLTLISRTTRATASAGQSARDDLGRARVLLDVGLEDRVEHVVRRQRVLVGLVVAQLGRRRARDDPLGDHAAERVAVARRAGRRASWRCPSARRSRRPCRRRASRSRPPSRSCCRWSARSRRTCSTAPSASCRGCAPGCSPRSRRRPARGTAARARRGRRRTVPRSGSRRSATPSSPAISRESSRLIAAV